MHEIGVLYKAVETANQISEENGIDELKFITLEIGELTGYIPVFFEKYFPIVVEDFPRLKNAHLNIEVIKGQALCSECQSFYNVMTHEGVCPKCKSREKKIISGQEFKIKEMGY